MGFHKNNLRDRRVDKKRGCSSKPKRRRPWNKNLKLEKKECNAATSSSSKKLNYEDYGTSQFLGYRLFDFNLLSDSVANSLSCKQCGGDVSLRETSLTGLAGNYTISCRNCHANEKFNSSKNIGQRGISYDINIRSVLAMRILGIGLAGLKTFCGVMDLPPPINPNSFNKMKMKMLEATRTVAESSMRKAVEEEIEKTQEIEKKTDSIYQLARKLEEDEERTVKESEAMEVDEYQERREQEDRESRMEVDEYQERTEHEEQEEQEMKEREEQERTEHEEQEIEEKEKQKSIKIRGRKQRKKPKNIKAKGDGTWQKRGHTSLNGAVSLIGAESNNVIDHEVLTIYCKQCNVWKKENGLQEGDKWNGWYQKHKPNCTKNYNGSSGAMESAGMLRIFKRSISQYNVRYTEYIGDGDAKTFLNIQRAEPYGPAHPVSELECVGHVGKRFGYHLRKLKVQLKGKKLSDGKTLFGKGRLTEQWIVKIQTFYGGAIRNNSSSLNGMIRAIWAIWYHIGSTDADPKHHLCPRGRSSWCKYQKAQATNKLESFHHQRSLPEAVMEAIKPIFVKMTSINLLKRCLGGYTQNSNESFNNVLWRLCPKTVFVGCDTVKIAANIATVIFNDGMKGFLSIMQQLGTTPGSFAIEAAKRRDKERIYAAEKEATADNKIIRAAYKKLQLTWVQNLLDDEENEYEAGAY